VAYTVVPRRRGISGEYPATAPDQPTVTLGMLKYKRKPALIMTVTPAPSRSQMPESPQGAEPARHRSVDELGPSLENAAKGVSQSIKMRAQKKPESPRKLLLALGTSKYFNSQDHRYYSGVG
jgi:hypothetical protein